MMLLPHHIRGSNDTIAREHYFCLLRRFDLSSKRSDALCCERTGDKIERLIISAGAYTSLQARVRAITEIVAELQRGVKEGRDVNLNTIKRDVCCCRIPTAGYTLPQLSMRH